jgi:hypothetical protein
MEEVDFRALHVRKLSDIRENSSEILPKVGRDNNGLEFHGYASFACGF